MRINIIAKVLACVVLVSVGLACGRDTGYLYEKDPVRRNDGLGDKDDLALSSANYKSITWVFNCPSEPATLPIPKPGPGEFVFTDLGPHKLTRERMNGTQIKIMGELCKPVQFPRDAVFVFDTSGSMNDNDELDRSTKSCGRLKAFEAVTDVIDWSRTEVGVLMFDSNIWRDSKKLFRSKAALVSELTRKGKDEIHEVLCRYGGGTNYKAAFEKAENLLKMGKEGATKEIFFVTDGEATGGDEGFDVIQRLKSTGVVIGGKKHPARIATIMLGDDQHGSNILRDKYASQDAQGNPMHANVTDAKLLAETLADMAGGNKIAGAFVKHGTTAPQQIKLDIMPHLKGSIFELPPFTLDVDAQSDGYEFELEYWDNLAKNYRAFGKLEWYR